MRVIVTGSRGWRNERIIRDALMEFRREAEFAGEKLVVIHGYNPKGADRIADLICTNERIEKIRVPANWRRYRKAAGPKRNGQMLKEFGPVTYTLAFRAEGKSSGTDDMINKSVRADVTTYLYTEDSSVATLVRETRETHDATHA